MLSRLLKKTASAALLIAVVLNIIAAFTNVNEQ